MPYRVLLDGLLRSIRGADGALLVDATGEVVVEAGGSRDRHRLIGAYQGILLGQVRRAVERLSTGHVIQLVWRYSAGSVIVRPLKDGYFLVVSLSPSANLGEALHRSAGARTRMNEEL